jgi:hypothetical protein
LIFSESAKSEPFCKTGRSDWIAAGSAFSLECVGTHRPPFFRDEFAPGLRTFDFDIRQLYFGRAPEVCGNMKSRGSFVKRGNEIYISGVM